MKRSGHSLPVSRRARPARRGLTVAAIGPLRLVILSFAALILAGALLLMLPGATPADQPIGFIDALFTATSAVCVTGLVVRDTGAGFTAFGQALILALIQLGGLGIMTFSLILVSLFGRKLSMLHRSVVGQTLAGGADWEDFLPLLRIVFKYTLAVELLGAMLLFARWQPELGTAAAAWNAVFDSISAFCNAGFGLWADSLTRWRGDGLVNLVIASLIVLGGLGYPIVYEVLKTRFDRRTLSVHTRIALAATACLIAGGAAMIWLLEWRYSFAALATQDRLLAALFQSVTCRTAGFNTIDIGGLAPATLFLMILLMAVGGCPASTAGGLKTTTFSVIVLTAWSRLRHHKHVNVYNRTLPMTVVADSFSLTLAAVAILIAGVFLLLLMEDPAARGGNFVFLDYLFETVSALSTVRLSTGVTASLQPLSRIVIVALMFVGRLGPLTIADSLTQYDRARDWRYAEEEVIIG